MISRKEETITRHKKDITAHRQWPVRTVIW